MKNTGTKLFILIITTILFSCDNWINEKKSIPLSDFAFEHIYNDFGSPRKNSSYAFSPININDSIFNNGLGFHAPSILKIHLGKKVKSFESYIGIDKEAKAVKESKKSFLDDQMLSALGYDRGATVRFYIVADGDTVYKSGIIDANTPLQKIQVDLENINDLELICDNAGDGYFADLADWADAKLITNERCSSSDFQISYYREKILVNHSGYLRHSPKLCVLPGVKERSFDVVNANTGETDYTGDSYLYNSDMGSWLKGDFSEFSKQGWYFIRSGDHKSERFAIYDSLYLSNIQKHLHFLKEQRSGDPDNGRSKGQHLDDGIRPDNGQLIDAVGGWYDAADVRKATFIDIINLFSLAEIYDSDINDQSVLDEIKWGNLSFLKLQDPTGYMMYSVGFNGVGQANPGEGERNYNTYTDNIRGTWDDRPIQINPSMIVAQMLFVISELKVADIFKNSDADYSDQCKDAAVRCFNWLQKNQKCIVSYDYGAGISAALELYKATNDSSYIQIAEDCTKILLGFQEKNNTPVKGWFTNWHDNPELAVPLNYLNWHLFGLCDFVEAFPDHLLADSIKNAIQSYSEDYLLRIAEMSPFNLLPYGVFRDDQGGGRKIGGFYFRYGVQNNYDDMWWNGINSNIAALGYGLVRAAKILDKPKYINVAQSQLDWIYGCNPFNASTVTGIGYNQPDWFKTEEFYPFVPQITGAVMAGIGTDQMDEFVLNPGTWNTTEYWLPPTAYIMLLLDALNAALIDQ